MASRPAPVSLEAPALQPREEVAGCLRELAPNQTSRANCLEEAVAGQALRSDERAPRADAVADDVAIVDVPGPCGSSGA